MRRYGAALSQHPESAVATGELIGQLLDEVGPEPDLVVVFMSVEHSDAASDIAETLVAGLRPKALLGSTAGSVIGGCHEIEEGPALAVWAASGIGPLRAGHFVAERSEGGITITGFDPPTDGTVLLLADPFSFPTDVLLTALAVERPGLEVIGGLASGAVAPGGNRLLADAAVHQHGAVGVILPPDVVTTVVSQGCRPVGAPFVVTRAEDNVVFELGGQPATARIQELIDGLDDDDKELLRRGLHIGVVVDESQLEFRRGDFLIRGVIGVDPDAGSVTVGMHVAVGTTLQFHVRDAVTADEDLRDLLRGRTGGAGLLFTCNGRGTHMFDDADHDANLVAGALDARPLSGMSCAGEVGPVRGASHLHGFTASVAFFTR